MTTFSSPRSADDGIWRKPTVAAMVAETDLAVGHYVETLGYTAVGDGGGNTYEIVAAGTAVSPELDDGEYIDLAGSGLQAKGLFPDGFRWMQFGAVGDGVTDDHAAMQNLIFYMRRINRANPWYTSARAADPVILGGANEIQPAPGKVFAISDRLLFDEDNNGLRVGACSIKALAGTLTAADHLIDRVGVNASHITLDRLHINCARICSGIQTQSFWRVLQATIRSMAKGGTGITLRGVKSYVFDCDIKEIDNLDKDLFFDETNYGAVGIHFIGGDHRVLWGEIGWCEKCVVRETGVNSEMVEVHLFNGMETYTTHNKDGSLIADNPGGTPAVGRTDSVLIEIMRDPIPGKWAPFKVTSGYFDNGKIIIHDDEGVMLDSCEFNSKQDVSTPASDVWIENYCLARLKPNGDPIGEDDVEGPDYPVRPYGINQLIVRNAVSGVEGQPRKLVTWLPNPDTAEDWVFNPSDFEASEANLVKDHGRVYNIGERVNSYGSIAVSQQFRSQAITGWIELLGRDGLGTRWGARTDDAVFAADGAFLFEELDGTDLAKLARTGFLPPLRTADPTGVARGTIYYNTSTGKLRLLSAIGWVSLN